MSTIEEESKIITIQNIDEAINLFTSLNFDCEIDFMLFENEIFCIMANYEWKRHYGQRGSDLEEHLVPQMNPKAMQYLNALIIYWNNVGHPGIPFMAYNGINLDNMYNVLLRASQENIDLPVSTYKKVPR